MLLDAWLEVECLFARWIALASSRETVFGHLKVAYTTGSRFLFLKSSACGSLLILCKLGKETRFAARHSPLVRSRDVCSIALKTLGKERDCSQSKGSLNFSRLLLSLSLGRETSESTGLFGDVRWCHESNVVIYEISHATFSAKTSLDKTVKFWWTSIISTFLSTICKIYKNSLKLCSGPLVKIIILLSVCLVRSLNTLELNIP